MFTNVSCARTSNNEIKLCPSLRSSNKSTILRPACKKQKQKYWLMHMIVDMGESIEDMLMEQTWQMYGLWQLFVVVHLHSLLK